MKKEVPQHQRFGRQARPKKGKSGPQLRKSGYVHEARIVGGQVVIAWLDVS